MTDKQNFDDLKTPPLAWIGVVSVLATVVVVLFLQVWYFSFVGQSTPTSEGPRPYEQLLADQQKTLDSYAILDEENDRAGIPISVAMQQVVSELAAADGQEPQQNPVEPPPGDPNETDASAPDAEADIPDESPTEDEPIDNVTDTDETDAAKATDTEQPSSPEAKEEGKEGDEKSEEDPTDSAEVETP